MSERPKRPWYSFRWMILFWIILPFAIISIADLITFWRMAR